MLKLMVRGSASPEPQMSGGSCLRRYFKGDLAFLRGPNLAQREHASGHLLRRDPPICP